MTNLEITTIATGGGNHPVGIASAPAGSYVYVVHRDTGTVTAIDVATNGVSQISTSVSTAASVAFLAMSPDGSRAYVDFYGRPQIAIIDTEPGSPTFHTEVGTITPTTVGNYKQLAVTTDGSTLIVGASTPHNAILIDLVPGSATENTEVHSFPLTSPPDGVVAQPLSYAAAYVSTEDMLHVIGPAVFGTACFGDGGPSPGCTNCPCGNNAPAGIRGGCLNSAGTSARLLASGDTSVSLPPNSFVDLRFALSGAPPLAFCILNSGDALAPLNPANPCFGLGSGVQAMQFDGLRCSVMNTRRHGGRSANALGDVGFNQAGSPWGGEGGPPVGIAVAGGGFVAGQTRYFQVINRDDSLLGCMRGLNTSQAVEVTFTP